MKTSMMTLLRKLQIRLVTNTRKKLIRESRERYIIDIAFTERDISTSVLKVKYLLTKSDQIKGNVMSLNGASLKL